jgi:ATP-binding cassette subfamily B protein
VTTRARDISVHELPPGYRSVARALRLGYRAEPVLLVLSAVATLAAAVPDALMALGFRQLTEAVVSTRQSSIFAAAGFLAALAVLGWLLNLASDRANLRFAEHAAVPIESYVARLQSSVVTIEHQERPEHLDLLSALRDHAGALSQLYRSLFLVVGAIIRLLLTIGLLMSVKPVLGLLAVFAVPQILASARAGAAENRAERAGAQDRRRARGWFVMGSTASPGREIRVAGMQQQVGQGYAACWERAYRPLARARWIGMLLPSLAWAVFGAAFIGSVAYVAQGSGSASSRAGAAVLVLGAGSRLSLYIGQTVNEVHFFRTIWLDVSRKLTWLEDYAAAREVSADLPAPARIEQGIRLENVSFRYPGRDKPALEAVDLTLPPGSVVAIVGENGAGKSTLVKLLCRFYEPSEGRITVDGVDLARITPTEWRGAAAATFQDFVRFELRADQSVGVGDLPRLADRAAVGDAIERAGAETVVDTLVHGLDTQLGSTWRDGAELSFGQWQKLALARGFMRERPLVLFLDEPAAALDAETEHALFERYAAVARSPEQRANGRITVLVSHRFTTIRMADLIVVLDGAHVAECGSHDQLMAAGGKYAELYRIQEESYA